MGSTLDVLIETAPPVGEAMGRSQHDAPEVDGMVRIRGLEMGRPGAVVPVRITETDDYDLVGEAAL